MSTRTIELPENIWQDLDELSREKRQPVDATVAELVSRQLVVARFRALRDKTIPLAQARGFDTDDDVFKAIS